MAALTLQASVLLWSNQWLG